MIPRDEGLLFRFEKSSCYSLKVVHLDTTVPPVVNMLNRHKRWLLTQDRHALSSQIVPQDGKHVYVTYSKYWSWAPGAARNQDRHIDWTSLVTWPWLDISYVIVFQASVLKNFTSILIILVHQAHTGSLKVQHDRILSIYNDPRYTASGSVLFTPNNADKI